MNYYSYIIIFCLCFILEQFFSYREKNKYFPTYIFNLSLALINKSVFFLLPYSALLIYIFNNPYEGLKIPLFIQFLFLDFSFYVWHLANHKVKFFWIFHKLHHQDESLNSSTGIRFHTIELINSHILFKGVLIFIGFDLKLLILFDIFVLCFSIFHHSNIKLPLEKYLSYILVTPCHHLPHHDEHKDYADCNYSVIFSFWDRLFRTYSSRVPIKIGLLSSKDKSK